MNDRLPLEGSISIITGARGVIGRGISRELAAAGSDVVLQIERDQRDSIEVNDAARA
jgi:NAD(P)-dependent dehydrogenase (short-subunit alcohol dehydrogenase family)